MPAGRPPDPRRELAFARFDERATVREVREEFDVPARTARDWRQAWKALRGETTRPGRARSRADAPTPEREAVDLTELSARDRTAWLMQRQQANAERAHRDASYGPAGQSFTQLGKLGHEYDGLREQVADPYDAMTFDELVAADIADLRALPPHQQRDYLKAITAALTPGPRLVAGEQDRETG